MSDDKSISFLNLGKLSKPADTLIKKISDAVGGIFAPYQITRIAKAEAKASLIRTESEIHITELHRRAMHRFVEEEAKRQNNMENITAKAVPQLEDKGDPSKIDDDWITNFFDKCRIVSDDEMQNLWSKLLSGEANAPGRFSKRTINFLSDLDKTDAMLFKELCGFAWVIGYVVPLIFDTREEIYNNKSINFDSLSHLESIGLIQFNDLTGFVRQRLPKKIQISYYGKILKLEFKNELENQLQLGKVLLTRVGRELALVCGSTPVSGFMEFVKGRWANYLPADNAEP